MEAALGWFGQIFNALLMIFPRIAIVRATHGGVKWRWGKKAIPLNPGLHVYWPLTTEIEIVPIARQTANIPTQVLTTKNGKKITIGIVVVYRINDVVLAFGKTNWDVDTTVNDIAQAAVVGIIAGHTFDDLLIKIGEEKMNDLLTEVAKKELSKFGVAVLECKLTDFAECRVLKIMLDAVNSPKVPEN